MQEFRRQKVRMQNFVRFNSSFLLRTSDFRGIFAIFLVAKEKDLWIAKQAQFGRVV